MSEYDKAMRELIARKCPACGGRGEVTDAEPGDIAFNIYICGHCKGSGFKPDAANNG